MSYPTTIFSKKSRSRLGLSGAVVALILVVIGIAVTLIVGSVVGGVIGGWARKEGLAIDLVQANIVGNPGSGRWLCVLVVVKNIGSSEVTSLNAWMDPGAIQLNSMGATEIEPGQTGTFSSCITTTLQRGDIISVSVTGSIPTGGSVGDRRSAPIT